MNETIERGFGTKRNLQEYEDEDLGPDTRVLMVAVHAEGFKSGDEEKDGGPAAVEREREVDEYPISPRLGDVVFLYNIVNVLKENYLRNILSLRSEMDLQQQTRRRRE